MGIACLGECKNGIVAVLGAVHAIEYQTVVVYILLLQAVFVTVDDAMQLLEKLQVVSERLCHVIVELFTVWGGMHHHHTMVVFCIPTGYLILHEVKVGHCRNVVVFCGVGVQTNKLGASCDETEIHFTEDVVVCFISCA